MELIKCEVCQKDISPNATTCPNCGDPIKSKRETFLEKVGRISPGLTPLLIAFFGGTFTVVKWYDDKETRQEEARKNEVWLAQQLEGEQAMQRADRAVELLKYLSSDKGYERKLSILLSLAFASQNQLSDGIVPVLVQAGMEDAEFREDLKYALLNLKDEAEKGADGDQGSDRKSKLYHRVVEVLSRFFPGELAAVMTSGNEEAKRKGVQSILEKVGNEDTPQEAQLETVKETLQVLEKSNSKDSDLIGEEVQKFASAESNQSGEVAAQSELFRISREVLSPQKRDKIFESGIRLVIAINHPEQKAGAEALAERLAPLFSTLSEKRNFRFVIENAREAGADIPATPEIRFRQGSNSEEIPETVRKIQDSLRGKLDFKSVGLPETQVAEGEFEIWLGDGQIL
jgi:hypothetical protein